MTKERKKILRTSETRIGQKNNKYSLKEITGKQMDDVVENFTWKRNPKQLLGDE